MVCSFVTMYVRVGTNLMIGYLVWYCDNVRYSLDCVNSRVFWVCGTESKQYCVFNKQYTRENMKIGSADYRTHD